MSITLTRLYSDTHHYDAGTVQINIPFVGNTLAIELTTKPEYATTEQRIGTLFQFSGTAQKAYDLYSGKDIVKLELPETDKLWFSPTSYLSDNYVLTIDYTNVGSVINGSNTVSVPEQILGLPARVTALENVPVVSTIQWDSVTGKPLLFMPSQHNHVISEVTGLTDVLAGYNLSIQNIEVRLSAVELALRPPVPVAMLWTPSAINTGLWLDASDIASVTVISGGVSQWNDKSGNNKNATQLSASSRPVLGSLNGLGTLSFDGLDDFLSLPRGFLVTDNYSLFILATPDLGTEGYLYSFLNESTARQSSIITKYGSKAYEFYESNGAARFTLGAESLAGFNLLSYDISGTTVTGYANGSASGSGSVSGSSLEFRTIASALTSNYAQTEIAAIVVLPTVATTQNRQKIEGYLLHQRALTAKLPSGHPYKTIPPYV